MASTCDSKSREAEEHHDNENEGLQPNAHKGGIPRHLDLLLHELLLLLWEI